METILVFIWGMLGGLLRLKITNLINYSYFPISTLIINLIGSFLLPFWKNYLCKKLKLSSLINNSFGTGFIGSFTTFSGLILDSFKLLEVHQILFFILYIVISIIFGIILAIWGNQLALKLSQER